MRLWSFHPKYLDRQGLLGLWREALLAQKVLRGLTRGYISHPQVVRFRSTSAPLRHISNYLWVVAREGKERGYNFDVEKIGNPPLIGLPKIVIPEGQLAYEWELLLYKLRKRNPAAHVCNLHVGSPKPHPIMCVVPGEIETWEKVRPEVLRRMKASCSNTHT